MVRRRCERANATAFTRRKWLQAATTGLAALGVGTHSPCVGRDDAAIGGPPGDLREPERTAGTARIKDYIRRSRQAALDELKPTAQQLERALALHREAVVCDPMGGHIEQSHLYGLFSAAMDEFVRGELARFENPGWDEVRSILRALVTRRAVELAADPRMQRDLQALMRASGVTVCVNSTEPWLPERVAYRTYLADALDFVEKLVGLESVAELKERGQFGALWYNHGRPLIDPSRGPLENLDLLYLMGVRWSQLTHGERNNEYAGGQRSDPTSGLTDLGRAMVKRMNELGIVVDASHTSPRAALEMADASEQPVMVSHTACKSVDHGYAPYRNMTDEGLKSIAGTGGVVAICTHPDLVGGYRVDSFVDHVSHAVKLIGADHVAVSTDRTLMLQGAPPELIDAVRPSKLRPFAQAGQYPGFGRWRRYRETWDLYTKPTALQPCAWPYNITLPLVRAGFSDDDIRKIIGGNVVRVVGRVLSHRPTMKDVDMGPSP